MSHNKSLYNPILQQCLRLLLEQKSWEELISVLKRMTNSQFRIAGYLMREKLMPELSYDTFWKCFTTLYEESPRAWLMVSLQAAITQYQRSRVQNNTASFDFQHQSFVHLCQTIVREQRTIDEQKILQTILPELKTPEEVMDLLLLFSKERPEQVISVLVRVNTLPCNYVLFQQLRQMDHLPEKLAFYCTELLKRGDDGSFNLVSIIKHYFDLPQVKGNFALKIKPYELSRLETNYTEFVRWMKRI